MKPSRGNRAGRPFAAISGSADAPDSILASHRREVTVRSATCADSAPLPRRPSPKRSWRSCGNIRHGTAHLPYEGTLERFAGGGIHDYLQRSDPLSRSYRLSCLDMREKMAELAKEASRVPRPSRYRGRACAQDRQWTLLQERGRRSSDASSFIAGVKLLLGRSKKDYRDKVAEVDLR